MKAKVINSSSDYYHVIIDVKLINFKYVSGIGAGMNKRIKLSYEDVEFIYDHEWEKNIVKHRDILLVSLPPKASPEFYALLSCALEEHIKEDIMSILVLSDINECSHKKYWYKRIVAVINGSLPVSITSYGKDYSGYYNINIEDIDIDKFICECKCGIKKMENVIDTGIKQIGLYERVLCNVERYNKGSMSHKLLEEGNPPA